jgi:hypothetical protein
VAVKSRVAILFQRRESCFFERGGPRSPVIYKLTPSCRFTGEGVKSLFAHVRALGQIGVGILNVSKLASAVLLVSFPDCGTVRARDSRPVAV